MSTVPPVDGEIRRRHFVAIATSQYDDPAYKPLAVDAEVRAMRAWLCSPELGERVFTPAYQELADHPTKRLVRDALEDPRPGGGGGRRTRQWSSSPATG